MKESCFLVYYSHFSFKCFHDFAFVRDISPKKSGSFGRYRHELVNNSTTSCIFELIKSPDFSNFIF